MTPPRARPAIETPSLAATRFFGCGPFLRRSLSHCGGSACRAASSLRVIAFSWNSAGVAGRYTSSFFAAVAGFMDCAFGLLMAPAYR